MKKKINNILIITFLVILIIPTLVGITGVEKALYKNEELKSFPKIKINQPRKTIVDIKKYYENDFGLQHTLFKKYRNLTEKTFNDNPLPAKVVKGLNGWLFLGDSDNNALTESLGYIHFSEIEMQKIALKIKEQKEWLLERNIDYYISIAPNKHTVYSECLPLPKSNNNTKLEVLKKYLKATVNIDVIDLKEYIVPKKDSIQVYHKHDTHWNDYGAFFGYEKLIDVLQKKHPILKKQRIHKSDIEIDTITHIVGDLNKLLKHTTTEKITLLRKKGKSNVEQVKEVLEKTERYINEEKKLKILIFRDSFSNAIKKYINETFHETIYIWNYSFNKQLIEKEKPDIVIYEVVERYIDKLKD